MSLSAKSIISIDALSRVSISGCATWKAESRGISQPTANEGAAEMFSTALSGFAVTRAVAARSSSSASRTAGR